MKKNRSRKGRTNGKVGRTPGGSHTASQLEAENSQPAWEQVALQKPTYQKMQLEVGTTKISQDELTTLDWQCKENGVIKKDLEWKRKARKNIVEMKERASLFEVGKGVLGIGWVSFMHCNLITLIVHCNCEQSNILKSFWCKLNLSYFSEISVTRCCH